MKRLLLVLFLALAQASHGLIVPKGPGSNDAWNDSSLVNSLKLAAFTQASGCPLILLFPSNNNASSHKAYLTPSLCIMGSHSLTASSACPLSDPVLRKMYLELPVQLLSSGLLAEAQETLSPVLLGRSLEYLLPVGMRIVKSRVPMELLWETSQPTGLLRIQCRLRSCSDLVPEIFANRWEFLDDTQLEVELSLPSGNLHRPIKMRSEIVLANWNRNLLIPTALARLPSCSNLRHQATIAVSESCRVNVYRNTDKKGHFLIEPMLCYHGNYSSITGTNGSEVRLTLEITSDRVKTLVRARIVDLSPLSVEFMQLVDIDMKVPKELESIWTLGSLRTKADGAEAELLIQCRTRSSCLRLTNTIETSPENIWRHLVFNARLHVDFGCSWQTHKYAIAMKPSKCNRPGTLSAFSSLYQEKIGSLCVRLEFVKNLAEIRSTELCAFHCNRTENCQAFSLANSHCQLFLFNKCSRNLLDPTCLRRGQLYIRRLPGLAPGRLCPNGYGNSWRGMKYKLYRKAGDWVTGRRRCEADRGLVVMADVQSPEEFHWTRNISRATFYLGGFQTLGSEEPLGGWHWVACDTPVASGMWATGEPNNWLGAQENVITIVNNIETGINDEKHDNRYGVLCKCVSPFE